MASQYRPQLPWVTTYIDYDIARGVATPRALPSLGSGSGSGDMSRRAIDENNLHGGLDAGYGRLHDA